MENFSLELWLCMLIATAIKHPSAPPSGNKPNDILPDKSKSSKKGGHIIGKILEAAITKVTEESFDALKAFLSDQLLKKTKLFIAGYLTYLASFLINNLDRLLAIAQLICLVALIRVCTLIYLAVKPKPRRKRRRPKTGS